MSNATRRTKRCVAPLTVWQRRRSFWSPCTRHSCQLRLRPPLFSPALFRIRSGCFIPTRTATLHCLSAAAMRPRTTGPGVDPACPGTAAATATTPQPGARLSARSPAHARSGSSSASVPTRTVAATPTRAPSPAWHQGAYPGRAPKLHALGARASSPTTAAAASSDSLGDYVAASPVAPLLGLSPSAVEATRSAQWDLWAERLTQQLQLPASLDAAARCVCARHTVNCHSPCRLPAWRARPKKVDE